MRVEKGREGKGSRVKEGHGRWKMSEEREERLLDCEREIECARGDMRVYMYIYVRVHVPACVTSTVSLRITSSGSSYCKPSSHMPCTHVRITTREYVPYPYDAHLFSTSFTIPAIGSPIRLK